MKRLYPLLITLLVIIMFATACAPKAEVVPTEDAGAPAVVVEATTAPVVNEPAAEVATEVPTEAPKEPVLLIYASNSTPLSSLDRFSSKGVSGDDTGRLWTDALLSSTHKGDYVPLLAETWSVSADGLSYTFNLRKGVKFTNGDDFTSADVKKTFDRLLEDETLTDAGTWTSSLDHVDTPDDFTAVVFLKQLMPTFYDEIDRVPVIDSKAYEADPENYFFSPIGTGAFMVKSFDKDTSEVHFTRNDAYWGWTSDNKSNVDEIVYKFIGESTTRASALQANDIDIATELTMDYLATFDTSEFTPNPVALDRHYHIGYSCADSSWFKDKNLREAFSLSIDRQLLIDAIYNGGGVVSTWPVPIDNLGYLPGYSYEYNPEKAKELIAASGYKGEEIPLMMATSRPPRATEVAAAIQAMAAEVGFNIKLDIVESATYETNRTSGAYQINIGSFNPTGGDFYKDIAVNVLKDKFLSGCFSEELLAAAEKAAVTVDRTERGKYYEQIFTIEMNDFVPAAYLFTSQFLYPMKSNISNVTFYTDGTVLLKFAQKD